nr:unnamed protein product [Callosobruchus analis]
MIAEVSGFLNVLENEAHVMADRESERTDELFSKKNNTSISPPSVSTKMKHSRREVELSKRIASLCRTNYINDKGVRHFRTQCLYSFELNKVFISIILLYYYDL